MNHEIRVQYECIVNELLRINMALDLFEYFKLKASHNERLCLELAKSNFVYKMLDLQI